MHLVPALVAVAAVAMISTPAPTRPVDTAPPATVQFTNNTTGTASVRANGAALFTDVAAGQTTEWGNVSDSVVTFVMVTGETGTDSAWVSQVIAEDARYTLVGTVMEGKPSLTITAATPAEKPVPSGPDRR